MKQKGFISYMNISAIQNKGGGPMFRYNLINECNKYKLHSPCFICLT